MWNNEPELYRRKYYARCGSGASTRRKSLRTNKLDVATRRLADLRRHDHKQPTLIKDIYAEYKSEKENKYRNLEYIWNNLEPTFGNLRPDQITRKLCKEYMMKRKVKNGTILRELGALRAALKWFDPNTPAVFDFPKAPPPNDRYLTRAEVKRLLDACIEPHIRLYIILAITTAGRKSAILGLTWDKINFEAGRINLGSGEANKRRAIVPMNMTSERALEDAYKTSMCDYVVEYRSERVKDIKHGFSLTANRAGLKGVHPHVLRHTAAVWMAEDGVPMSEIAQYLGHTSTRVTERVYARYSPEYLKKSANSLELSSIEHGGTAYVDS
jgi:integrase